jgi:hypothetical protein
VPETRWFDLLAKWTTQRGESSAHGEAEQNAGDLRQFSEVLAAGDAQAELLQGIGDDVKVVAADGQCVLSSQERLRLADTDVGLGFHSAKEALMRRAESTTESEQVHHLLENLMNRLAKGRKWATPGVHAALQRAVAGLDTGIETESPRLQTVCAGWLTSLRAGWRR